MPTSDAARTTGAIVVPDSISPRGAERDHGSVICLGRGRLVAQELMLKQQSGLAESA